MPHRGCLALVVVSIKEISVLKFSFNIFTVINKQEYYRFLTNQTVKSIKVKLFHQKVSDINFFPRRARIRNIPIYFLEL